jgi:hypothetical protein
VQNWLDNPSENLGLLIKPDHDGDPGLDGTMHTTANFAAKEYPERDLRPKLKIDYTTPVPDGNNDGIIDTWEVSFFWGTNASSGGANEDYDSDGAIDRHEYVAGTDPADENDHLKLNIALSDDEVVVSFLTLELDPQYYVESSRFYSLEETTDPLFGTWLGVTEYTNLIGKNAVQFYSNAAPSSADGFYRAITWLE